LFYSNSQLAGVRRHDVVEAPAPCYCAPDVCSCNCRAPLAGCHPHQSFAAGVLRHVVLAATSTISPMTFLPSRRHLYCSAHHRGRVMLLAISTPRHRSCPIAPKTSPTFSSTPSSCVPARRCLPSLLRRSACLAINIFRALELSVRSPDAQQLLLALYCPASNVVRVRRRKSCVLAVTLHRHDQR
jgi:hypothetical protein